MERRRLEAVVARPNHERLFAVCEMLRRRRREVGDDRAHRGLSAIDRFWLTMAELVALDVWRESRTLRALESATRRCPWPDGVDRFRHGRYRCRRVSGEIAVLLYFARGAATRCGQPRRKRSSSSAAGPSVSGKGLNSTIQCVHAAWALREAGCSPVVINNNPETVSTDFDISDVLIFEPPGADEVEAAYRATNARGVMLAFGGQTAINLAGELVDAACGSSAAIARSLDMAEDREKFDAALAAWASRGRKVKPRESSAKRARSRASSVSGSRAAVVRLGRARMEIVYNEGQLASYAESAPPILPDAPLLVDKYLRGLEVEVDAVFDGEDILIPGIFEHIERAGIHSGDSISVYPAQTIGAGDGRRELPMSRDAIARELRDPRLINIQFVIHDDQLYIIEANPRASRTVPIIQKATGINMVAAATRIALGERLRDMEYGTGLAAARAVRRGQSSGLFVFEDARRRNDSRARDEVDGRGARNRRNLRGRVA